MYANICNLLDGPQHLYNLHSSPFELTELAQRPRLGSEDLDSVLILELLAGEANTTSRGQCIGE